MNKYRIRTENTVFEGYECDCLKYLVGFLGLVPYRDFDLYKPEDANGVYSSTHGIVTVEDIE